MNEYTYFSIVLAAALALLVGAVAYPEPLQLEPPPGWGVTAYERYFQAADSRGFASPQAVLVARLEAAAQAWAASPKAVRAAKRATAALRPTFSASAPGKQAAKFSASYDLPSGQLFAAWTSPSFALEGRFTPQVTLALRLPAARLSAAFSAASGLLSERLQVFDRLALVFTQGPYFSGGFEAALNF